jgi:hypothetical protein
MIFKQFYLESLGHASYFIGSEDTGEALVLDVRRDVDDYLEEAQARGCGCGTPPTPISTMITSPESVSCRNEPR